MSLYVKYIDIPAGAQEEMDVVIPASQPFSTGNLAEGVQDVPWATLEPNSWALDGTRRILPDNATGIGWWSAERSGEDGRFTENPVFVLRFDNTYTAPGITVDFWKSLNHWCNEIVVRWFYETRTATVFERNELYSVTAYPSSPVFALDHNVSGFNCVEIELVSTNIPEQFAKISHIQIGRVLVFGKDELVRVSLLNEVDPSAMELSADSLTVEILEKNNHKLNPQKNQKMQVFRNEDMIASHYINEVTREKKNSYKFQCYSVIEQLDETFLGGLYNEAPAGSVLREVLGDIPFDLEAKYYDARINGYLPVCTKREALQQIAFAIGAVVTTQTDGVIHLKSLNEEVTGELADGDIFTGAKLQTELPISKITVMDHMYAYSAAKIERVLDGVPVKGKDVLVLFNGPYYVEETALTGIANIDTYELGVNYIRVTTRSEGNDYFPASLTFDGYKIVDAATENTWQNTAVKPEQGKELVVDNATLVTYKNVEDVIERLKKYGDLRSVLTQDVVVRGQKAGDKVQSQTPFGTLITGYITSMESEFTQNGHTASVTIQGKEE